MTSFLLVELETDPDAGDYTMIYQVTDQIRGGLTIEDIAVHRAVVAQTKEAGVEVISEATFKERFPPRY